MPTQVRREIVLEGPLYLDPRGPLDPVAVFGRRAPLVIDIGAARARFFRNVAPDLPGVDFLGIEVKRKRVEDALERLAKDGIANARMMLGDALSRVALHVAEASAAAFTILYPDPWPKKRHAKRRIFERPETAALLASRLEPGGLVMLKSDAHDCFLAMREAFAATAGLVPVERGSVELAWAPPFELDTPAETYYERKWKDEGRALHKAFFRRVAP